MAAPGLTRTAQCSSAKSAERAEHHLPHNLPFRRANAPLAAFDLLAQDFQQQVLEANVHGVALMQLEGQNALA